MAYDKFLIAPLNSGLQNNVKPFLIPDDAYAELNNAYPFRGRIRKRFGSQLMNGSVSPTVAQQYSRLRIQIGTTAAVTGNLGATVVPGTLPANIGQMFSIGTTMFTVYQAAGAMLTTGAATGTFDTVTGTVVITGNATNPSTAVFWYPALPVMGLLSYEQAAINDEPVYAFDTQFSYEFSAGAWRRLGTATWTGNNADFFWAWSYQGATDDLTYLFVTNYVTADQIKYWDGATWTTIHPIVFDNGLPLPDTIVVRLETALLIVPFKDRLVALNTKESTNGGAALTYVNRARFCQFGSPVAVDAWREDLPGKGDFLDAPTKEAILSCEFLKDRLIVYFERSTWELAFTNNDVLPFVWQQLNTELGVESTHSIVPFDKVVIGVGNVGVHACNGSNVDRIDEKIPTEVFDIHNGNSGVKRVYGIRDYFTELIYWTFPSADLDPVYPTRVLVFNYATGSWAFNDDSITCFGYYQPTSDTTWADADFTWEEAEEAWNAGIFQSQYRMIIGGNQEGYVFIINPDLGRNAPALQITNLTFIDNLVTLKVIDHNLPPQSYIVLENIQGTGNIAATLNGQVIQLYSVDDKDTVTILQDNLVGDYTGGGTITRMSEIDILTKQYNFYADQGLNAYVAKAEFMVDKTAHGEISVDYYVSSSDVSMVNSAEVTGTLLGKSTLDTFPYDLLPLEATQRRLWHPLYLQSSGEVVQLRFYFNADQIVDTDISWSDFQLHAMLFSATPVGRLQ